MRQLAAQVQAVFGAVETALLRLLHGIDHLLQILKTIAAIAHVANHHASSTVVMPLATIMRHGCSSPSGPASLPSAAG